MRKKTKNTQRELEMIRNVRQATATHLSDHYQSWSYQKQRAFDWCQEIAAELKPINTPVLPSRNTFSFTYGFEYFGPTGERRLRYETSSNSYDFEIFEEEE